MKIDFLISASPSRGMLSQIALFKLCLLSLGGFYSRARLVAVLGDHEKEVLPSTWRHWFDDIEVEWAHRPGAENPHYRAQHDVRFEVMRRDADIVFLCDADTVPMRPFDGLMEDLMARPALAGVIAHYHFPINGQKGDPKRDWSMLASRIIGSGIDTPNRYTLHSPECTDRAPFYINYGLFAGPPDLLSEFYRRDRQLRDLVADVIGGHWWAPQVSLALTCAELQLPTLALPVRYNFPNDPKAESLYPEDLIQIVFLHYLRLQFFDRQKVFADPYAFGEFLDLNLAGSNRTFQDFVLRLTGGRYPFRF